MYSSVNMKEVLINRVRKHKLTTDITHDKEILLTLVVFFF